MLRRFVKGGLRPLFTRNSGPSLLAIALLAAPAGAATLLPNGEQTFIDGNGAPLANGSACFYAIGGLSPKTTWTDSAQTTPNTSPCVTLDGAGRAIIYGQGAYREIVKDSLGNTVWDQPTMDAVSSQVFYGGTSGGSANAQTLTLSPPRVALVAGDTFVFVAGATNSGATTLTVDSTGTFNVLKGGNGGPIALVGNELVLGNMVALAWDGTEFQLVASQVNLASVTTPINMVGAAINEAQGTIASAATMAIGAAGGNSLLVTGNSGPISAFDTIQAGALRRLLFQSNPQITYNATSMITPNATNIQAQAGDVAWAESQGGGNWKILALDRFTGQSARPPRGYIGGLTLSNDSGTPNTVLDVAAGMTASQGGNMMITLGAMTKSISGPWVAGSGGNGMGAGLTAASSTWYHVCAAVINGAPDVFFDTSPVCANGPTTGTGTFASRRIGSFKTDGSTHILAFKQVGDTFYWTGTAALDLSGASVVTANRTLFTINVPTGIVVEALFKCTGSAGAGTDLIITSPDETDYNLAAQDAASGTTVVGGAYTRRTNTSAQLGYRAVGAALSLSQYTFGWRDFLGRFD